MLCCVAHPGFTVSAGVGAGFMSFISGAAALTVLPHPLLHPAQCVHHRLVIRTRPGPVLNTQRHHEKSRAFFLYRCYSFTRSCVQKKKEKKDRTEPVSESKSDGGMDGWKENRRVTGGTDLPAGYAV